MDGYSDRSGAYTLHVYCPVAPTFMGSLACGDDVVGNTTNATTTRLHVAANESPEHWYSFNASRTGA